MAENEKYRRIIKMHDHYKGVILRWENTMSKIKGQKPTKEDFETAPKDVREAYKQYHKYKQHLVKHANAIQLLQSSSSSKRTITPKKIFVGGLKSQSLQSFDKTSGSSDGGSSEMDTNVKKNPMIKNISEKLFSIPSVEPKRKQGALMLRNKVSPESTTTKDSHEKGSEIDTEITETVLSFFEEQNSQMSGSSNVDFTTLSEESMSVDDSSKYIDDMDLSHDFFIPSASFVTPFVNNQTSSSCFHNQTDKTIPYSSTFQYQHSEVSNDENEFFSSPMTTPNISLNSHNALEVTSSSPTKVVTHDVPLDDYILPDNETNSSPPVASSHEVPKRKFTLAFSPSPEKQPKKKKFFKSDRNEKRYSLASCIGIPLGGKAGKASKAQQKKTNKVDNLKQIIPTEDKNLAALSRLVHHDSSASAKISTSQTPQGTTIATKAKSDANQEKTSAKNIKSSISKDDKPGPSKKSTTVKQKPVAKKTTTSRKKSTTKGTKPGPSTSSTSTKKQSVEEADNDQYEDDYNPVSGEKVKGKGTRRGFPGRNNGRRKQLNDNFVRIDVSKKVFVRGRRRMTGAKMKRLDWKVKKSTAARERQLSVTTCKKCGDVGHFSKFCQKGRMEAPIVTEIVEEIDNSPWPTVEEAARMVWTKKSTDITTKRCVLYEKSESSCAPTVENNDQCNDSVDEIGENDKTCYSVNTSESLTQSYEAFEIANKRVETSLGPYIDNSTLEDDLERDLSKTLELFGYENFRHGQKETVMRVLKGESTLMISSTGSGKSLCYQLPAYLYAKKHPGALTICVSPLVSLMEDQVEGMPNFITGVALHCQLTPKKKEQNIELIKNKQAQILLASPEAVASGLFGLLRGGNIPDIAFACIDEVHCVSEWSHNFRPTYLELCKILRDKLNVKTILGLTATATAQTEVSICDHLKIDPASTIRGEIVPKNLHLSVSRDQDRNLALLHLLRGDRFKDCNSIIIYCTTREECDRVATFIRTNIQDNSAHNSVIPIARSRISTNCEAYHARLSTTRRRYVQKHFMSGNIRIVVATIAFGMGIDKSDIRAVIHYNMSKTYELYVQEIGRAGRDGLPGQCHLFLDNIKGKDLSELRRHIYSNSVDRVSIRRLLRRIFKPCKCKRIENISERTVSTRQSQNSKRCPGHEVAFTYEQVVKDLDIPGENISTLLCFLELDKNRKWIEILPMTYAICKIHSYGGAHMLKAAALKCPPLAVAIALEKEKKKFKDGDVYLEFNVVEAASTVGWSSATVKRELKNLEWAGNQFDAQGNPTKFRKSGILVEFSELAYRVKAPGDLTDEESDEVLAYLSGVNAEQERTQLFQLYKLYQSFYSVSSANVGAACDEFNEQHSETLKSAICEYFKQENQGVPSSWKPPQQGIEKEDEIRRDVANLLFSNKDAQFTGRAVAKIFQGISSPCFPSEDWNRNRAFWRRYLDVDFHLLAKIASEEILRYS